MPDELDASSPARPGYPCTAQAGSCPGATSGWSGRCPLLVGQWARWGLVTGNGEGAPMRPLGGLGQSGWNSCSAEVSVGIASVAIQHAQLWVFFSSVTEQNSVWNTEGCLQPTLLSACVITSAASPCPAVASLLINKFYEAFLAISPKLAGDVCSSRPSAQTKGWHTESVPHTEKPPLTSQGPRFLLQLQLQTPDHVHPLLLYLNRTEGLNGTMVASTKAFI